MFRLRLVKEKTTFDFFRIRWIGFVVTTVMIVGGAIDVAVQGLNFGIDFRGGTLIEVRYAEAAPDLGALRAQLGSLQLGEVAIQEFGEPRDILVRVVRQEGDERAQMAALQKIREVLAAGNAEIRRTEVVGPQVGQELVEAGVLAILLSMLGIAVYIWFRFEWQFGVGALVSLLHDIVATVAMFAVLGLEFNLSSVAAVLLIAGYSINDTVVVYDRIRENLRKYRKASMPELVNLSINDTLSRTALTSGTTLVALIALYVFGGQVIADFTFAMIFGILIGTYSSVFVAAPILHYLPKTSVGDRAVEPAKS